MSTTVYVLLLADRKYYVGKTEKDVGIRYQEHVSGRGSAWTRMYKPLMLIKTFPNADPYDEDKRTKEYMALYGIDNVRGGSYVQMDLNEDHRAAIQREIWMAENRCTKCGIKGHYAKDCNAQAVVTASKRGRDEAGETLCFRCGRRGHVIADCYAAGRLNGYHFGSVMQEIPLQRIVKSKIDEAVCYRCGRAGHMVADCYAACHLNGHYLGSVMQEIPLQRTVKSKIDEAVCYRCGRAGHMVADCYAACHLNGHYLGSVMQEIPLQRTVKSKIDEAVCYRLDQADHMVADYYAKCFSMGYAQNTISKSKSKAVEVKSQATSVKRKVKTKELEVVCYRCGRPGHVRPECYAARHVKGYDLDDD